MDSQFKEQLQGIVERLTYHSESTGYTVARFKVASMSELVTIVGNFAQLQPGQTLALQGFWKEHPIHGTQFVMTQYQEILPATLTGIEKYLGSGLIKGVGPKTAKRIVSHFGLDTLEIIEHQSHRLSEIPGIAIKRIKMIQKAWSEQKSISEVMLFLQSHGVSTLYAIKIFKQYGNKAIETVTQNPYQLATDIYGIGFLSADKIALNLGLACSSQFRYKSGLLHVLGTASEQGHCFLPSSQLISEAIKLLTSNDHKPQPDKLAQIIAQMGTDEELVIELGRESLEGHHLCYKPSFFHTEQHLAQSILKLIRSPISVDLPRVENWIMRFMAKTQIQLSIEQQQAIIITASWRIAILTGSPGTGKTLTTRAIVALFKAMGKSIALAAPTGRAAKRMTEVTGMEAKTLHRLLEFDPSTFSFKRNSENPIRSDIVIIDETSMLDLFLANSLFKALGRGTQLLLVGDIDQLPSVGPGRVLQDLITSQQIKVIRLTEVFRQAQASRIITNAHRINQGNYPILEAVSKNPQSDCLHYETLEPLQGIDAIKELIQKLPQWGFNPLLDVQVLCPMTKADVGTKNLNQILQQVLNPPLTGKTELHRGGTILRVGDRVIQRVNDYNREVFNGDQGKILEVNLEDQEIQIQFEDRIVSYDYADLDEISLAYAVTVHKSQGSEYPVVILPFFTQHYMMLSRNLLYTGLTRAKQLAIIVGQSKAIGIALKQIKDQERYTLLHQRLKSRA